MKKYRSYKDFTLHPFEQLKNLEVEDDGRLLDLEDCNELLQLRKKPIKDWSGQHLALHGR
jgi:hypothetical protein